MAEHILSTSYSFFSQELDGPYASPGEGHGKLLVANVEGKEEVSTPYQFDLTLLSSDGALELEKILASPGWLQIMSRVPGEDQPQYHIFHGRLAFFEQTGHSAEGHLYTARLVPQIWKLKRTVQNRVFVEESTNKKSIEDLTKEILKPHGLEETTNYRFDLSTRTHAPKQEYTVQYEESDFDFLSRWLEHHGISYLFDQSGSNEVIVFTDKLDSFAEESDILNYRGEVTEGSSPANLPGVTTISCRKNPVPKEVVLKDYKWDNPDLNLECTATVKATSEGTVYEYNNNYETTEEGKFLATLRSTELLAKETLYSGTSNCVFSAGSLWELEGHPGSSFANKYLVIKVHHHGTQGFNLGTLVQESGSYTNSFTCIPSEVAFCPPRKTEWPTVPGVLRAKVVAPSDSKEDLDDQGQYKVQLALDRKNNSSNRIRMSQPYADSQHSQGMHYPLYQNTEVTLTHMGGNPDRPIISGAVPTRTNNVVSSTNQGELGFRTKNGVQVFGHDQDNNRWIRIKAGESATGIQVTEKDFLGIVGVNTTVETIATRTKSWAHFSNETAAGYSISNASAVKYGITAIPLITALSAANKFGLSPLIHQWSSIAQGIGDMAVSKGICTVIKKKVKSGAMEIPTPPDPTDEAAVEAAEVEAGAQEEEATSLADKAKWVKDKLIEGARALPGAVAGASSAVAGAVASAAYSKGGINMFSGGPSVMGGSLLTVQSEFPNLTPGKGDIQIGTQYGAVRIMGGTGNEENGTEIFGNRLVNIWSPNMVTLEGEGGKMILNKTHAYLSAGNKTQISASDKRIFLHQDEAVMFLEKDDIWASASKKITLRAEPTPVASPSDQCKIEMTKPGTIAQEAGKSLTLKGPGNTITLDDDGVELDQGIVNSIKITKDGDVEISASKIKVDATSTITIEAKSNITLNAKGQLHLKGTKVYLGDQCMIG